MTSTDEIFDRFGGPAAVGRLIGVSTEHAAAMKRRGSIPPAYWADLIAHAAEHGIGLTSDDLVRIASLKRRPDHPPDFCSARKLETAR